MRLAHCHALQKSCARRLAAGAALPCARTGHRSQLPQLFCAPSVRTHSPLTACSVSAAALLCASAAVRTVQPAAFWPPSSRARRLTTAASLASSPSPSPSPRCSFDTSPSEDQAMRDALQPLLRTLPPTRLAVGYGSGVFLQRGYNAKEKPMVDMILGVDDAAAWHRDNLRRNPHHYSFMKYCGTRAIVLLQDKMGGRIYYNTSVQLGERVVKYGVITVEALVDDLLHWRSLYVAGRFHKPVLSLLEEVPGAVRYAASANKEHALRAGLLMLPRSHFTEQELYESIAALSYLGDFRMAVAENPNKIRNIVAASLPRFRALYDRPLQRLLDVPFLLKRSDSPSATAPATFELTEDVHVLHHELLRPLPLSRLVKRPYNTRAQLRSQVENAITTIVWRPALTQTLKGFLSSGPLKSVRYALAKLKKRQSAAASK